MLTLVDMLRKKHAERKTATQAVRELERVSDPKRHAARLRAEAYAQSHCPIRKMARADQPALSTIHNHLSSFTEYLKEVRAPITAKAEALRKAGNFGGNINRYAVYHLIDKHRRGTSFTPFVKRFLSDYKAARELDSTLTREQFFSAYTDHVMDFLSTYKLIERPRLNAARIEYLSLRAGVAVVAPLRHKYGEKFDAASELSARAQARFDTFSRKAISKQGGFFK